LLIQIVNELKGIKESVGELQEIKKSVADLEEIKKSVAELGGIKKSVGNLEKNMSELRDDVSDIKYIINQGVFVDIKKLEKRIEVLEEKVG
jgi:predicted  nucleic acid-binding Zn-ribbon protein